ncbi:hypothetical protein [Agromyces sp. NPDC058064]|uniref:hypothetical protein n=1 Tax=Agromyces sp. NPDC058064 TaxID=3346322 RepID=UPI0036DB159D
MHLTGTIRPTTASEIVADGHDRGSAYDALSAQVPDGFELARAHFSMKAGTTTATGVIRAARTEEITAEGAGYAAACAALEAEVPDGYQLLYRTITG